MPQLQVASVPCYDFAAPAALAEVLAWRVLKGGRLVLTFENEDTAALTVEVEASVDNSSYAVLTVAKNGLQIGTGTGVAIPAKTRKTYEINVAYAGSATSGDNYIRIEAAGSVRGNVQIRGEAMLELILGSMKHS
jgi:hypothetical protein